MSKYVLGPRLALGSIAFSILCLYIAVIVVDDAQPFRTFEKSNEYTLLSVGAALYITSVLSGLAGVIVWFIGKREPIPVPEQVEAPLAPAVALVGMAQGFIDRLHKTLIVAGLFSIVGSLGLLAAASLVADGTQKGPLAIPGKIWVVSLDVWQVQVTTWGFLLVGIITAMVIGEYKRIVQLRSAWTHEFPEV
jgi:hypothetical protein